MKIDFTQVLKDFDGEPIKGVGEEDVTLEFICVDALLATLPDEQKSPNADDYIRRYEFAKAIRKDKEMDLKAEDIVLLKGRILKTRPVLVYGITSDMLEKKEDGGTNEPVDDTKPGYKNI